MHFCTRSRIERGWREPASSVQRWDRKLSVRALPLILVSPNDQNTSLQELINKRFDRLSRKWRAETRFVSSLTDIVLNSSYQGIIGMGDVALPLIMRDLETNGGYWFWALKHISGEDPLSEAD